MSDNSKKIDKNNNDGLMGIIDNMIDNDEDFEAPCFCTQQLSGLLFGSVFGYIIYLILHYEISIAIALSTGITFGLLASESTNPFDIDIHEFLLLDMILICQSFSLLLAFGINDIFIIFLLIILLSAIAAPIRSLMRYRSTILTTHPNHNITNNGVIHGKITREEILTAHAV